MNRRGLVIALSGVDCAGKSTQRGFLLESLRASGYTPVTVWTRVGYTPWMEALKRGLRALGRRKKSPRTRTSERPGRYPRRASDLGGPWRRRLWLSGALLELLWVYGVRIRFWRARGRAVVCDRYLLDCLVDLRVNFPADAAERAWLGRLLRRISVRPDYACCLMVEAERTLERSRQKSRHHWETLEVLRRRRAEYERVSHELGVPVLDGERPVPEIARALRLGIAGVLASDVEELGSEPAGQELGAG